jgi:hypothetical protein
MSDTASRRTKEPVSDLSQVLAYGPAYRESYGKFLGALLMLYAITKTRKCRGDVLLQYVLEVRH